MSLNDLTERILASGCEDLSDKELTDIFTDQKRCPPLDMIRSLEPGELIRRYRLTRLEAARLICCLEIGRRMHARPKSMSTILCAQDAYAAVINLPFRSDRECFGVLTLDTRHRCIASQIASIGTLNASLVHAREVFRCAVRNNAYAVVIAHNHPSGDPTPSEDDMNVTDAMKRAGRILGIRLLDHLIVTDDSFYSFAEQKVMVPDTLPDREAAGSPKPQAIEMPEVKPEETPPGKPGEKPAGKAGGKSSKSGGNTSGNQGNTGKKQS